MPGVTILRAHNSRHDERPYRSGYESRIRCRSSGSPLDERAPCQPLESELHSLFIGGSVREPDSNLCAPSGADAYRISVVRRICSAPGIFPHGNWHAK